MEIKRDRYLKKLLDRKENGLVKVITGIRRCGKSYLLFQLYKKELISQGIDSEHIITLALDDIENIEYRDAIKLYKYIKAQIKCWNGWKAQTFSQRLPAQDTTVPVKAAW